MKDLANVITPKRVLSPVSTDADTALVGEIIDKKGFESVTYVIATGSIGDANATFTVLLEEGDAAAMGDATAVADADLLEEDGDPADLIAVARTGGSGVRQLRHSPASSSATTTSASSSATSAVSATRA